MSTEDSTEPRWWAHEGHDTTVELLLTGLDVVLEAVITRNSKLLVPGAFIAGTALVKINGGRHHEGTDTESAAGIGGAACAEP